MKIISWNVNGIRAVHKKGLLDFIYREKADIYCFQETKASQEVVDDSLKNLSGYHAYWHSAQKKGYSGLLVYSRDKALSVVYGIGDKEIDAEGRVLALEFPNFYLVNAYFPHSGRELERLNFKLGFNKKFLKFCGQLKKPVVIASDFNVAHQEIDLANPKQNEKNAGFTSDERDWFGGFLGKGYVDTFRSFVSGGGHYTWWTWRNDARERNIGWRIDYFVVSGELKERVGKSYILKQVKGSDHCPIGMEIED